MKRVLVLLCLFCCTIAANAQDQIYMKDGSVTEAYVKKIGSKMITYTATPASPQRFLKKSLVEKVVYKRGREVMMETRATIAAEKRKSQMSNLHNMLTISPLPLMFWGNYSGIGLGADYERFVGKSHRLSVHIPVYVGLIVSASIEPGIDHNEAVIVYTSPGIRFHLLNPESRFDYAIGVSGLVGNANHSKVVINTTAGYPNEDQQYLLTAVTLDNDINLTSKRKKILLGVHTAVGPVLGDFGEDGKWMVQVGFKIGRRF